MDAPLMFSWIVSIFSNTEFQSFKGDNPMTITELRKKRASVWESAKAFLNSHRQENGLLSAVDDST